MPTTIAGTADRAAGAATSTAGSSTTTTSPSGSMRSGLRAGTGPVVLYGHSHGRPHRPRLPPDRPPETRPRGALVARPRLDARLVEEDRSHPSCRGSSRRWPSRTGSTARRCRATRPWPRKVGADPLSAGASTARFAAEALAEQARVRREYARVDAADTRPPRPRRRARPGPGVGDPRHRFPTSSGEPTPGSATSSTTNPKDRRSSTRSSTGSGSRRPGVLRFPPN